MKEKKSTIKKQIPVWMIWSPEDEDVILWSASKTAKMSWLYVNDAFSTTTNQLQRVGFYAVKGISTWNKTGTRKT